MNWIVDNLGTIVISVVLIVIVAVVIRYVIKNKSKAICGGDCAHCRGCSGTCKMNHTSGGTPQ